MGRRPYFYKLTFSIATYLKGMFGILRGNRINWFVIVVVQDLIRSGGEYQRKLDMETFIQMLRIPTNLILILQVNAEGKLIKLESWISFILRIWLFYFFR